MATAATVTMIMIEFIGGWCEIHAQQRCPRRHGLQMLTTAQLERPANRIGDGALAKISRVERAIAQISGQVVGKHSIAE